MTTHDDPPAATRIVLVDDHQVFASALSASLDVEPDLEVVGIAHDLATAERVLGAARPDVALLDHRLPDGDGVTSLGRLRQASPDTRFVILTASTAEQVLVAAIDAGAAGFVSKTRSLDELTAAVRAAAAGEAVISPELLVRLLPRMRAGGGAPAARLTQREVEVLDLMAKGLSNAAIAEELVVSVHTIRNHVANLSTKLDAHSKLEAVSRALKEGLIAAP